jgi:ABC-type branched-subunit amino acid transport system substrate-binding protein
VEIAQVTWKPLFRPLSVLALGGVLLAAAISPVHGAQAQPELSSKSIKIGGVFASFGSPSVLASPILAGYKLAFKAANAHGGIYGRRIDYVTQDDNYDPSKTVPAVRQLVQAQHIFAVAGIFGSDDSNAALPYLESAHVPFVDPIGGGASVSGRHWVWQSEPEYAREGTVIGSYLGQHLHVHRVAVLYQVGINEPEVAAIKTRLKSFHGSVKPVPYHATDVAMSPQLAQVRQYNPDIVVLLGTLVPTSQFVKTAAGNGYRPKKGYFANYPQGDPTWLQLTSGQTNGSLVSSYADLTGNNAESRAYRNAIKHYDRHQQYTNYGLYGYFNGGLLIRALRLAGKNPSRSALQRVLDTKFRNYKSSFTGVLNWTQSYRYGVRQFKIYRISGSQFKPLTGWLSS